MGVSRESIEAIKILVAREGRGEFLPVGWEDWSESELITLAANPAGTIYVNVYQLARVCGGPEEGGWWFDTGEIELSIVCDSEESAIARAELLAETYQDHGNRFSVIYYSKAPDFEIRIENKPAAAWPKLYPRYE